MEKGYLLIRDRFISELGEEEILEEEVLPDLLIRGENKLVAPGLIDVFSVPYISALKDLAEVREIDIRELEKEIVTKLSDTDLYYLSILGVASRIINGYTTIVAKLPRIEIGAKIVDDMNIRLIVALDLDYLDLNKIIDQFIRAKKWHYYREGLLRVTLFTRRRDVLERVLPHAQSEMPILVGGELCYEKLSPEVIKRIVLVDPSEDGCELIDLVNTIYTDRFRRFGRKIFYGTGYNKPQDLMKIFLGRGESHYMYLSKLSREAASLLNIPSGSLEKGFLSDLVIYDIAESPVLGVFLNEEVASRYVLGRELVIETMIIDGEFVIDGGETLYIGRDILRRARSVLKESLREIVSI